MKQLRNKKAYFDYAFKDKIEAGMVLVGDEIKAIRAHKVSLAGAFGRIIYSHKRNPELYLVNAHIEAGEKNPTRSRKLLVHRHEIDKLIGQTRQKGLTLIPTRIYLKHGRAKVELALGRGRKKSDKRELIKKRDLEREAKQKGFKI